MLLGDLAAGWDRARAHTHKQHVLKVSLRVFAVMVSAVLSIVIFGSCVIFLPSTRADGCSSYWDDSGIRRGDLQCGHIYCCGTCSNKYCCTEKTGQLIQELCDDRPRFEKHSTGGPLLLFIILGAVIPIIFCVGLITCFVAPCCFLYKKCRKQRTSRRQPNVTTTYVVAPHQPASPPHHPSHPNYQPVPVPPHYGGLAMPTAPVGIYMGANPPAYPPGGPPPHLDEHSQPPYNPAYGFNP